MTIQTLDYATKREQKADLLRNKKANKWKRRILTGLAGIVASIPVLTNGNLWSKLGNFTPQATDIQYNYMPAIWYVHSKGVYGWIKTEKNEYSADLSWNKKPKSLRLDIDRNGNLPAEISYYSSDHENLYNKSIKLP